VRSEFNQNITTPLRKHFTAEEDEVIVRAYGLYGNNWGRISLEQMLHENGRTKRSIKDRCPKQHHYESKLTKDRSNIP